MKATILQDGTLKVIPENGTESYALRMWNLGFSMTDHSASTLWIAHDDIQPPQGGEVQP